MADVDVTTLEPAGEKVKQVVAVYDVATGELVSVTDDPELVGKDLDVKLAVVTFPDLSIEELAAKVWDKATQAFIDTPAPVLTADEQRIEELLAKTDPKTWTPEDQVDALRLLLFARKRTR